MAARFYGLKPAVLAIVASAVIRIGSKALKNEVMWSLAALAFSRLCVLCTAIVQIARSLRAMLQGN